MGSLFEMIQKMLGSGMSGGGMGGMMGGGAGAGGGMMGGGGAGGGGSFMQGLQGGMKLGGGESSGRGKLDTSASDHQMGLSALQQYRDMADHSARPQPQLPLGQLGSLTSLANSQKSNHFQATKPNAYVQFLMGRMNGAQYERV